MIRTVKIPYLGFGTLQLQNACEGDFFAHFTKSRIWDFVNYSSKSPPKIVHAEKPASERHTKSCIWDFVF